MLLEVAFARDPKERRYVIVLVSQVKGEVRDFLKTKKILYFLEERPPPSFATFLSVWMWLISNPDLALILMTSVIVLSGTLTGCLATLCM